METLNNVVFKENHNASEHLKIERRARIIRPAASEKASVGCFSCFSSNKVSHDDDDSERVVYDVVMVSYIHIFYTDLLYLYFT